MQGLAPLFLFILPDNSDLKIMKMLKTATRASGGHIFILIG
jgi:hypothetical protein